PTRNEEGNILPLIERIDKALTLKNISYEIIFIDDHSTDNTQTIISGFSSSYPITLHMKKGIIGKAQSLIEGFSYAKYDIICMIDADLQYPPEAIPPMMEKITKGNADIVVANRNDRHVT